jgi:hypothetical protein
MADHTAFEGSQATFSIAGPTNLGPAVSLHSPGSRIYQ